MSLQKRLWKIVEKDSINELQNFMIHHKTFVLLTDLKSGDHVTHVLARNGQLSLLKFLRKEYCVALDIANREGKVPLHEASLHGKIDIVIYLLEERVNIDPLKRSGWTPLMSSCSKSNLSIVKTLVEFGANVHLTNKDGWTCFHIACREGNTEILQYLISVSSSIWNTSSNNGRTPLHTAALYGKANVVKFLLTTCNAIIDARDACGTSPFLDSVRSDNVATIQVFLHYKPTCIEDRDQMGLGCFHVAAEANNVLALLHLASCVDDINTQVEVDGICKGQTPLHFAFKERNIEAIDALLSLNANKNIKDNRGKTAGELWAPWTIRWPA